MRRASSRTRTDGARSGPALATQLGCTGSDADALACMRGQQRRRCSRTELPTPAMQVPGGPFYQTALLPDGLPNVDGFVLAKPLAMLRMPAARAAPAITRHEPDEGTLFHSPLFAMRSPTRPVPRRARAPVRRPGRRDRRALSGLLVPAANRALAEVTGDAFFVCPARRTARAVRAHGATASRYSFEHALEQPFLAGLGVFHSSELPFVFGNDTYPLGSIAAPRPRSSETMQSDWTSSPRAALPAANGRPTTARATCMQSSTSRRDRDGHEVRRSATSGTASASETCGLTFGGLRFFGVRDQRRGVLLDHVLVDDHLVHATAPGVSYMMSSIALSRMARRPRAPLLLRERLVRDLRAARPCVNLSFTPSISNSFWYCFTSAFFGCVRIVDQRLLVELVERARSPAGGR